MTDISELEYRIAELERRLVNVARPGVVSEADYPNARVKVSFGDAETTWLPWVTRRAGGDLDWWPPEVGEQVLVFSPSGELARGVVMPALYSTAHGAPESDPDIRKVLFADGTTIEFNRATSKLTVDVKGDVALIAAGNLDATVGGNAKVTANGIELDGAGGGGVKGLVQGDCVCAFTGAPHPQVSATVKGSQ